MSPHSQTRRHVPATPARVNGCPAVKSSSARGLSPADTSSPSCSLPVSPPFWQTFFFFFCLRELPTIPRVATLNTGAPGGSPRAIKSKLDVNKEEGPACSASAILKGTRKTFTLRIYEGPLKRHEIRGTQPWKQCYRGLFIKHSPPSNKNKFIDYFTITARLVEAGKREPERRSNDAVEEV